MVKCAEYGSELLIMVFLGTLFNLRQELFTTYLEIKLKKLLPEKDLNRIRLSVAMKLIKEFERVIRYGLPFKIKQFQTIYFSEYLCCILKVIL